MYFYTLALNIKKTEKIISFTIVTKRIKHSETVLKSANLVQWKLQTLLKVAKTQIKWMLFHIQGSET